MTFRHLEIFITVAETLNMSESAEKLFIAQPSVSQSVAELERHLKTRLFERLGRRLYLTSKGSEFLSYARHIMTLARDAESHMSKDKMGGTLRIGGTMSVATSVLCTLVKDFSTAHLQVRPALTVANTASLEKELLDDTIDIALIEGTVKSSHLAVFPVMDDELLIVTSADHKLAQKKSVSKAELQGQSFFIREEGSGTRQLFESVMSTHEIEYDLAGILNNAEAIKHAVAAGLGLSVLSKATIHKEIARGELAALKIKGMSFNRHFSLIYHKNKYITPILEAFIKQAQTLKDRKA